MQTAGFRGNPKGRGAFGPMTASLVVGVSSLDTLILLAPCPGSKILRVAFMGYFC